jgi:hypothetical protein
MNPSTPRLLLCRVLQVLGGLALGMWLMVCPLLWIVRDGLGPDSVETSGWAALQRFSPMLLMGIALMALLVLLHFCASRLQPLRPHGKAHDR